MTGEGIAYENRHFRNPDGSSRILYLWDQSILVDVEQNLIPPEGFLQGAEFDNARINQALNAQNAEEGFLMVPSRDVSGHGTAVASIAAGNPVRENSGNGLGGTLGNNLTGANFYGVAPESDLLVVKLGPVDANSFPRTTELMRALTYVMKKAVELNRPVAINLSFGNTYGAHDGTSLVERFLDNIAEIGRTVICVGSGNEGAAAGHVQGNLPGYVIGTGVGGGETRRPGERNVEIERGGSRIAEGGFGTGTEGAEMIRVELAVGSYESAFSVQLWKQYVDRFLVRLRSPGGEEQVLPLPGATSFGAGSRTQESGMTGKSDVGKQIVHMENTTILIYLGQPTPYTQTQEIYFDFISTGNYVTEGIWTFTLIPQEIVSGQYYFYLPSSNILNQGTRFFTPSPEVTLTIPSTATKVITVGAYDTVYDAYADFSGRGYVYGNQTSAARTIPGAISGAIQEKLRGNYDIGGIVKPDLVAPGVNVPGVDVRGGYGLFTGTSFATPFVTGAAALLMEWGIVQGNDAYLYGEKVRAYLRAGARPLRGENFYPNDKVGFGALCLSESIPG